MTDTTGEVIEYVYGKNQGLGAVELSRNMYKNSTSVVSTLCYGVQWDAALSFIATNKEHENFPIDSSGKGNYTGIVEKTGYYATNNIYDMAGNVSELTMEPFGNMSHWFRGYSYNGTSTGPASIRWMHSYVNAAEKNCGFRVTLYIK